MKSHISGVADTANTCRIYFGPVEVLHCTKTNRPADGVNEHGGNSSVGCVLVPRVNKKRHVNGHVDVSNALNGNTREHATAASKNINKAPSEHECEDEFYNSICSRCNQRGVRPDNTSIGEDLNLTCQYTRSRE